MKRYIIVVSMGDTHQYAKALEVTEIGVSEMFKVSSDDWYNNGAIEIAKKRLVEFRGLVAFDIVSI